MQRVTWKVNTRKMNKQKFSIDLEGQQIEVALKVQVNQVLNSKRLRVQKRSTTVNELAST